ncbi:MAG TPA: O-antigen ligase family protein [Xanthobacteraceae bacterium]
MRSEAAYPSLEVGKPALGLIRKPAPTGSGVARWWATRSRDGRQTRTPRTEPAAGPYLSAESLRGALLWLTGFSGAFVFIEPSPYELVAVIAGLLFLVMGLSVRPALTPLVLLLVLMNIGYAIAVAPVSDQSKPLTWVFVSAFLAATAIFYAAMVGTNTSWRLSLLLRGYVASALVASLAAFVGYFHLLGGVSDLFILYERARGTFNDPNVLGAFLILPVLLLFQRMMAGRRIVPSGLALLIMLAAMFLTFSRGAWAQLAVAGTVLMTLTFVTSRSPGERLRIMLMAIAGLLAVAVLVTVLLSVGQVSQLFSERAALEQDYDTGRFGRFGRWDLGADIALEHPFGIGPLQFWLLFVEDPHNSFLNAFLSGGWLAGFCYLALAAVTIVMSTRFLFMRTPWQPIYHAIYAAYVGTIAESAIIDIDHWRHYFLILGLLWGLMAASSRHAGEAHIARLAPSRCRLSGAPGLAGLWGLATAVLRTWPRGRRCCGHRRSVAQPG